MSRRDDGARDLPLYYRCGSVRGTARGFSPRTVNHGVCYCDDCQAFAHFLGRADDLLDPWGGTEIVQRSQARVVRTAGAAPVAAMWLTPKGLMRSYAGCCNAPIGNTLATPALPFIGMIRAFIDAQQEALGPIRRRMFAVRARAGGVAGCGGGFRDARARAAESPGLAAARGSQTLGVVRRGESASGRATRARRRRARAPQARSGSVAGSDPRRRLSRSCAASVTTAAPDR